MNRRRKIVNFARGTLGIPLPVPKPLLRHDPSAPIPVLTLARYPTRPLGERVLKPITIVPKLKKTRMGPVDTLNTRPLSRPLFVLAKEQTVPLGTPFLPITPSETHFPLLNRTIPPQTDGASTPIYPDTPWHLINPRTLQVSRVLPPSTFNMTKLTAVTTPLPSHR